MKHPADVAAAAVVHHHHSHADSREADHQGSARRAGGRSTIPRGRRGRAPRRAVGEAGPGEGAASPPPQGGGHITEKVAAERCASCVSRDCGWSREGRSGRTIRGRGGERE